MTKINETVFDGRDNVSLVSFSDVNTGLGLDFSAATRFVLTLGATIIDTDIDAAAIVTTAIQGQLQFTLGNLSLPLGKEYATLVVYDPAHPNGQIIICDSSKDISFTVVDCS